MIERANCFVLSAMIVLALRERGRHPQFIGRDGASITTDPAERELTLAELTAITWPACAHIWVANANGHVQKARRRFTTSLRSACLTLAKGGVLNQITEYENRPVGAAQRALLGIPQRGPIGPLYSINLNILTGRTSAGKSGSPTLGGRHGEKGSNGQQ